MNRSHLKAWVLTSSILSAWLYAQSIAAQVVPDSTLPVGERSQITGDTNVQIDGGARRGNNLFHSFSQFSIPTGGSAFFNNAADVQNIFSRITGSSISNIDGVLRTNGTANLFLLNPNGILFGPNASLNIGGSFVATTANAIGFSNGEIFSDTAQSIPSQLLNVNPNALFFNQLAAQSIINQSTFNGTGLQVPLRQNLLLVGGSVQLNDGRLISPESYIKLGGVDGVGTVGLSTTGEDWQLTIPTGTTRADVFLSNGSDINVKGAGGGISILARNLDISGSQLQIEIPRDSRLSNTQTGDLDLNATGSITISDSILTNRLFGQGTLGSINLAAGDRVSLNNSAVNNTVDRTGVGNAGNINITTGSLSLIGSAGLTAYTNGQGNTGSVNISARDTVSFDNGFVSSYVGNVGVGNAGDINITTGTLSLTQNAGLISFTAGQGNAGNVNISARDTISLTRSAGLTAYTGGQGNAGNVNISASDTVSFDNSNVFTIVSLFGDGNAGDINITTGALSLTNGARLYSNTLGQGNAGNVNINARDRVSLDGEFFSVSPTARIYNTSTIYTRVEPIGVGQGGNVTITTGSLSLTNGGAISAANNGGKGDAGSVIIHARDFVQIRGTAPTRPDYRSEVVTSTSAGSVGSAGDVTITTGSLSVSEQGRINTTAQGQGKAGNIQIRASDAVLFNSGDATSTLALGGVGSGGDIEIAAQSLSVLNGARLSAATAGTGNAGNINIDVLEGINISGINGSGQSSGLFTTTEPAATGSGGNIRVTTGTLTTQNQAEVTVSSLSAGRAGSLFVDANQIFLNNQGSIRADTTGGGGNINLRSPFILLSNGSNITTNATGSNIPGGNIAIDTRFLVAVPSEDSNISANSEDFRGGNVSIKAFSIYGIQRRPTLTPLSDIAATGATSALSGTIDVITTGINPTFGLIELPTDLVDSSGLIAQGCPANQGNSFVITGRGGLPPNPEQQLDDDADWQDRRRLTVAQQTNNGRGRSQKPEVRGEDLQPTLHTAIIEATGWQITRREVILVANASNPIVQNSLNHPIACQGK